MENLALQIENLDYNDFKKVLAILARKTKKGIFHSGSSGFKDYCRKIAAKLHSPGYEETLKVVLENVIKNK